MALRDAPGAVGYGLRFCCCVRVESRQEPFRPYLPCSLDPKYVPELMPIRPSKAGSKSGMMRLDMAFTTKIAAKIIVNSTI